MNNSNTGLSLPAANGLIDSRRLLYFYHVAKTGRFTIAETTLNIAQSALSRQLQQLEEDLGVRLFDRTGRGVRLTHFGHILLKHAETILHGMAATIEEINQARHEPQLNIAIAASPSFMATYMSDVILAFNQLCPESRIRAVEASTGGVYALLANGEVDLAIVVDPANRARLSLRKLIKETLYVVAKPDHPIAELEFVSRRQLKDLALVLPASVYGSRATLNQYAEAAGIQLRSQFEVDSLPLMRQMLYKHPICTILAAVTCKEELENGTLIARPLRPSLSRTLYLASLKGHPASDSMRALTNSIMKVVKPST